MFVEPNFVSKTPDDVAFGTGRVDKPKIDRSVLLFVSLPTPLNTFFELLGAPTVIGPKDDETSLPAFLPSLEPNPPVTAPRKLINVDADAETVALVDEEEEDETPVDCVIASEFGNA